VAQLATTERMERAADGPSRTAGSSGAAEPRAASRYTQPGQLAATEATGLLTASAHRALQHQATKKGTLAAAPRETTGAAIRDIAADGLDAAGEARASQLRAILDTEVKEQFYASSGAIVSRARRMMQAWHTAVRNNKGVTRHGWVWGSGAGRRGVGKRDQLRRGQRAPAGWPATYPAWPAGVGAEVGKHRSLSGLFERERPPRTRLPAVEDACRAAGHAMERALLQGGGLAVMR